ncbi:uncharacterized protein LOC108046894 [Drosophila rhopaloa]|uniref:Uncharacterized protein LOC108046894 n=1 Tax=Drosophila rhopaloa TaxID=1041015 RepID=A0A6P4F4Q0_DRORH|nr:uncharacterized protein LOC108046894 [Drosophila rhopaloa]
MELSQLDEQYNWRRSVLGMREETFGKPWNYNFRVPSNPAQLFKWLLSLDLPMLEDETPPWSFYFDLLEAKDIELERCVHSGKLLVSLAIQTMDGDEPRLEVPLAAESLEPGSRESGDDVPPSINIVAVPPHLASPCPSDDEKPSQSNDLVTLPRLVEIGTGPDEPPIVATFEERGTATDPVGVPEVIAPPPEEPPPPSHRSFCGLMKRAVLALSLVHSLYALSQIALGPSVAGGWESFAGVPTPPQMEETSWSLTACIWQHMASKLEGLRSRFP